MPGQGTQQAGDRLRDYVPVSERIGEFYELYANGRILTAIVEHDAERGFILMRAEVYRQPDDAMPAATGHAYEVRGEGVVNKTSYIENCETGCVGRALQNLGLETKRKPTATRQAPAASSKAAEPDNAPLATAEQKAQILELWNRLTAAGVFESSAAWQGDLHERTGVKSRDDLTQGKASAYITSLLRLERDTKAEADKRAEPDSAR